MEMNIIEKIKTIDNKIEQNKVPDVLPEKKHSLTLQKKFLKGLKRKKNIQKVELIRI